jgi:hypothetical protein
MNFSPADYGQRTAAVLNALVSKLAMKNQPYNTSLYHTFTTPEGTGIEVDLLLSCSGFEFSPIGRVITNAATYSLTKHGDEDLLRGFNNPFHNKPRDHGCSAIVKQVLEMRKAAKKVPFPKISCMYNFSDALFGPKVAKVLNALLSLEASFAECPKHQKYVPRFCNQFHSKAREPFALYSGKGTAYAADILTLEHNFPLGGLTTHVELQEYDSRVERALFPAFGELVPADLNTSVETAIRNVRKDMFYVVHTVEPTIVPVVMAGHSRLGRGSHLQKLNADVLRIIVRMAVEEGV